MNWYLDRQLKRILKQDSIPSDLEAAPLSVLTSSDLEYLEPYTLFHKHLDDWIKLYQQNEKVRAFSSYVQNLQKRNLRRNQFMKQQIDQIRAEMLKFFSHRGI